MVWSHCYSLRRYALDALLADDSKWQDVEGLRAASLAAQPPPVAQAATAAAAVAAAARRRSSLHKPPRPPPAVPSDDGSPGALPPPLPAKPLRKPPSLESLPSKPSRQPPALPTAPAAAMGAGLSLPCKLVLGAEAAEQTGRFWLRELPAASSSGGQDAFAACLVGPEGQAVLARCSVEDGGSTPPSRCWGHAMAQDCLTPCAALVLW